MNYFLISSIIEVVLFYYCTLKFTVNNLHIDDFYLIYSVSL
jgi:hypothetical protein